MRGVPGSGKSTLARELEQNHPGSAIFSTDNYWIRPDGYYDFNFKRLSEAHAWNFENFKNLLNIYKDTLADKNFALIIDNTNIQYAQFRKYVAAYIEAGFQMIAIEEPKTNWAFNAQVCFEKNTHNVPLETIKGMLSKWESKEDIANSIYGEFSEAYVFV